MSLRRSLVRALCLVAAMTAVTLATTERVTGSGVSTVLRATRLDATLQALVARGSDAPQRVIIRVQPGKRAALRQSLIGARRPGAVRPPVHRRDYRRRARTGPWPAGRRGPDVVDCGRCHRATHRVARHPDERPDGRDRQPAEDRGQRDSSRRRRHVRTRRAAIGPAQYPRRGRLTLDRTRCRDRGDRLGPGDVGGVPGTGHRVLRLDGRPHGGDIAL